jgi:phage tail sheath protein FI
MYFPRVTATDPLTGLPGTYSSCGAVAGAWASTDSTRGVWKAPAGTSASLPGGMYPAVLMTDDQNGELNPLGLNCLRTFPVIGPVVWGARTLRGSDAAESQWKYIPVRRTALYIEESLRRGTQWVVFEPNAEPLWASIRLSVGAFMQGLYRQGAFAGATPSQAYLVKCDAENNPPDQVALGIVNILVGFAPLYPAEFVLISIEQLQLAG